MLKRGPETKIRREVAYIRALCDASAEIVPVVLASGPGYYLMEQLTQYPANDAPMALANWPVLAESALQTQLWIHDPVVSRETDNTLRQHWRTSLDVTLGISAPAEWTDGEISCATHGDPTLSNTLLRGTQLVFCDPVWPERVPQIALIDCARIMQSMLGWEVVTGRADPCSWSPPQFLYSAVPRLQRLCFWTGVMMARIEAHEHSGALARQWAGVQKREMFHAAGV